MPFRVPRNKPPRDTFVRCAIMEPNRTPIAGLAVQAVGVLEDPAAVVGSLTILVEDLLSACGHVIDRSGLLR